MPAVTHVRDRFAPSPTGQLHVGNARTALFNWLFARQKRGKFVLRVEDTDVERSEGRFEQQLLADLRWLGLDWDEGPDVGGPYPPYRQSDKLGTYREHAERLVSEGKAYYCFCSAEDLERERTAALAADGQAGYSGKCRAIPREEAERRRAAGEAAAIRLHISDAPIRFHDLVRGTVEWPGEVIGDPIILRSTGMPVYNFVVVIDDAEMKITHVIRGDDHVSNTPRQVALYEALGWPVPEFAHLSTILGSDRERLSKRHGATSIASFREMGVLPEALMNYLALLGWAPSGGDREIFSREELVKEFQLERVTPSAAIFDFEKLYWLNRHYIKQLAPQRLLELGKPYLVAAGDLPEAASAEVDDWVLRLLQVCAPYVDRLDQLPARAAFIFRHEPQAALANAENGEVLSGASVQEVFTALAAEVRSRPAGSLTAEEFKGIINQVKQRTGTKGKDLYHPIRIVLTGAHSGPDFDKVIPLMEQGSRLALPRHVLSVRDRVEAFEAARPQAQTSR